MRISSVARTVFGSRSVAPASRPALMEMLETRQLLSTTVPPFHGPAPLVPSVTVSSVQGVGVTLNEVADNSFTAVVGEVTGLSAPQLANLKGLQATIKWNDYVGDTHTTKGTLSVSDGTLIVKGTHTYEYQGTHVITVTVSTVGGVTPVTGVVVDPVVLATITSNAIVTPDPVGVTFGVPSAGTAFTGVVGKVKGLNKATLGELSSLPVSISWGDNTAASAGTLSVNSNGVVSVTGTHTYAIDGQYKVTVTISTPATMTAAAATLVVIHSTADVAFVQPEGLTFHPEAKEPFDGVVGRVGGLDAATLGQISSLQAVITWGDGSATSDGTLSLNNGLLVVKGTHTYDHGGKYAVTVVVETIPPTITTAEVAPLVLATINSYAQVAANTEGGVHLYELKGHSFSSILGTYYFDNDNNLVQSASISWGDGKTSTGNIIQVGPTHANWAVKGTHEYDKAGIYHVEISVTATPAVTPGGVSNPIILLVANIKSTITVLS